MFFNNKHLLNQKNIDNMSSNLKRTILLGLLLTFVVISVADGATLRKRKKNKNKPNDNKEVDPDNFLEKFGYLGKPPEGVQHSPVARREAIKNFQRMVGLNVTGKLDKVTRKKMGAPRCGMPDMVPPGTHMPPPGVALDPSTNPQNFYVPGYKWEKTALTWKIDRISNDGLNRGDHRRAFYDAFKHWSDVTPLSFNEVTGNADINIDFNTYEHGDGSSFDGESGTLAHAFYPEDGRVHFDDSEVWTERTEEGTNLEIVAAHEFGHALGLGHSNVRGALMAPYYQGYMENFQLESDDVMAIQTLYGGSARPTPTKKPRPERTTTPAPNSPASDKDSCTTKFGAVMQAHDSRTYVFNKKWVWRLNDWGLDEGFPKRHTKVFKGAPYNIGAVVYSWRSRYTYFFKGKKVWKFYGFDKIERKKVTSRDYPSKVQAAFISRDGRIYLLSGSKYWEFDEYTMDVTRDGPRYISSKWPGVPSNIESAVRLNDGYIYFFKGEKYRKYDEYYGRVVSGYPKYKAGPWMGQECGGHYEPK